jgi:hypothetical protein
MQKLFLFFTIFLTVKSLNSQTKKEIIGTISKNACDCVSKINTSIDKASKSKEIYSCITSASTTYQLKNNLFDVLEKVKDSVTKNQTKIDTLTIGSKNINIITDKYYVEIEKYLYENCKELKSIYFSDNTRLENSVSKRKKALKYYDKGIEAFKKQNFGMLL